MNTNRTVELAKLQSRIDFLRWYGHSKHHWTLEQRREISKELGACIARSKELEQGT